MKGVRSDNARRVIREPFENEETNRIARSVELAMDDPTLGKSIVFSPTALALIRRVMITGGSVVADTEILARQLNNPLHSGFNTPVSCLSLIHI